MSETSMRINLKQDLLLQHSISIHSVSYQHPIKCRSNSWNPEYLTDQKSLEALPLQQNLCKERKKGRGETAQKNSASWLGMINKPVKEGCTVGRGRGEVIMWQRIIFLPEMPLGRRKQENVRIPPAHTMTLQNATGNLLMKSCSLMPSANSLFAKSHLLLITYRQLLGLNLLTLLLV